MLLNSETFIQFSQKTEPNQKLHFSPQHQNKTYLLQRMWNGKTLKQFMIKKVLSPAEWASEWEGFNVPPDTV